MTLFCKSSIAGKSWKKYFKKTQIDKSFILEHETFEDIQKIFDKLNFLHHQDSNHWLYVDLDISKQFEFSIIIYHMQDDKNEFLNHITKENCSKVQSIFFLSKLLTDAETWYWSTELEIACVIWTVKKICHMISRFLTETVIWTDHSVILQILKQTIFNSSFINKLNLHLIQVLQYCSQFEIDIWHQSDQLNKVSDVLSWLLNWIAKF